MRRLFNFTEFVNESSAAGNMDKTYNIPFKYSSHDPKEGYNSKSFVDDLKSVFIEKPELKREITSFISTTMRISNIDDLSTRPFSEISKIIPEIERIIEAGEYEPELKMPGGAILFIRNKILKNGRGADFYLNRAGTKIEVVTEDLGKIFEMGICLLYEIEYDGKYKYSLEEANSIKERICQLKYVFPYNIKHIAKNGNQYDFVSINEENKGEEINLSAKTTKKDGKLCPQVIGQPSKKKFCEFFGIDYYSLEQIKNYIQANTDVPWTLILFKVYTLTLKKVPHRLEIYIFFDTL